MSILFQGKYRITSIRKPDWNYGSNGAYFVTICCKDRKKYFGKVVNGKMEESEIGNLVIKFWAEIPDHFHFVKLGEFVVMPDHFHGIIIINHTAEAPNFGASTIIENDSEIQKWKAGNLGVIINQFKRICTIHARKINPMFAWQSRYHDHIFRNELGYHRIAEYIRKNPEKVGN